jgi:hypothetical protein
VKISLFFLHKQNFFESYINKAKKESVEFEMTVLIIIITHHKETTSQAQLSLKQEHFLLLRRMLE